MQTLSLAETMTDGEWWYRLYNNNEVKDFHMGAVSNV